MGYGQQFFERANNRTLVSATDDTDTGRSDVPAPSDDRTTWQTLGTYSVTALRDAFRQAVDSGDLVKVEAGITGRTARDKVSLLAETTPAYRWVKMRVYAGGGIELHPANRDGDTAASLKNKTADTYDNIDNILAVVSADDTRSLAGQRGEFVELIIPAEWLVNPRSRYRGVIDNEYHVGTDSVTFYLDESDSRLIVTAPGMTARHDVPYIRRGSDGAGDAGEADDSVQGLPDVPVTPRNYIEDYLPDTPAGVSETIAAEYADVRAARRRAWEKPLDDDSLTRVDAGAYLARIGTRLYTAYKDSSGRWWANEADNADGATRIENLREFRRWVRRQRDRMKQQAATPAA